VIELNHDSLARGLPAASGSPDWDDVLTRSRNREVRHRRLLVVGAAAVLVAVGTASAFAVRAFHSERVGFIGLPPEGAVQSTPERGKLVISYRGHAPAKISWTDRAWGKTFAWVYADGRLIWLREDDRPFGANHISTGYLEQRLTPDGVELLRSAIIATGVFEHERPSDFSPRRIEVRDGDRLLSASSGFGRHMGDRDGRKLAALFTDPASWLPEKAWADRQIRAYVPSRYVFCYLAPDAWKPARVMSLLPVRAKNLLRGNTPRKDSVTCWELTTNDARGIDRALDAADVERSRSAWVRGYNVEAPAGPNEDVFFFFEPVLPHGKWSISLGD
jgi:hypothetical protein